MGAGSAASARPITKPLTLALSPRAGEGISFHFTSGFKISLRSAIDSSPS